MSTVEAAPTGEVTPAPALAVEVHGLTKRYGDLIAVRDLDLAVPAGTIFGLIGPNGAGKSTTFLVLASLLAPSAGTVSVAGADPTADPRAVRASMGYMPDVMGVYDNLRVQEYLEFFAAAYRVPRGTWPSLVAGLLELVDLEGKRDSMVDSLSRGMKQRLSLARALVHDPKVLVLDEPASGLDPRARVDLRDLLRELRDMGKTVIISSHILAELEEVCSEVAIMEAGRLLAVGTPRSIGDTLGGGRVVRVRFADGDDESFTVGSDEEQQGLLTRLLVEEQRQVLEFTEVDRGLEQLFMRITKGDVR
ncbi:MAG: ABC transporter ATP-binding protein [Acidimicrobiales bacterium]